MGFREKLLELIREDKQNVPETKELLDALDGTLNKYAADIEELKLEKRKAGGSVTPEELAAMDKKLKELGDAKAELERTVKTLTKEKTDLTTQLGNATTDLRDFKNDSFMRKALSDVGVGKIAPEDIEDAINFIQRKMLHDNGKTFVKVLDEKGAEEKYPLEEYVTKVYPTTTHAKRFIPGGDNSGAGARGGAGAKQGSQSELETLYAEAQKKGDVGAMISLKEQMAKGDNK